MATLPGQQFIGGVSNYIFGTNTPNYDTSLVSDTQIQQQMKAAGVTLIRTSCNDSSGTSYTDAQLDSIYNAIHACGAVPLMILRFNNPTFNKHVVSYMKGRCLLYEYSNERDINGVTYQQYASAWNSEIPGLRVVDANAAFIGPVLGAFSNVDSWLIPWLKLVLPSASGDSRTLPDAISYHDYPCTGGPISSSTCLTRGGSIGSAGTTLRTKVTSTVGHSLPICCTEWNADAYYNNPTSGAPGGQNGQGYNTNAPANDTFNHQFAINALEGLVSNNLDMACHFELDYFLANKTGPTSTAPQYTAMQSESTLYLGPVGGSSGISVSPSSLSFSGVVSGSNPANQSVQVTNNGSASGSWTSSITYGSGSGWLSVSPSSGSLSSGSNATVTVSASLSGLSAGTYTATIHWSMTPGSSTASTSVTLTVSSSGSASPTVSPSTLSYTGITGGSSVSQTSTLTNNGGASGSWTSSITYGSGSGWLSFSPTSGTLASGANTTLTITANPSSLSAGTYTATITITLSTTATINVTFTVNASGGATPLTLYLANATSSTLSTADNLYTIAGTPSNIWKYSRVGTATGFGEITAQGTTSAWAASGSIGSPTGKGFFLDATTLDNQQIIAGNWSSTVRLNCAQNGDANQNAGTLIGDLYQRVYRYSGGTYTLIVTLSQTGQTIPSAFTTISLPIGAGSAINFSVSDKLYVDIWFKVTTNSNGSSVQDIRLNRLSTDTTGLTGDTNVAITTPGYQIPSTSGTFTLYLANATSSTLSTADNLYTIAGTPPNIWRYSRVGTATGFGEITAQGTTSAWAASGSIGSPTGKGFFLDATTLDNQQIIAGNWSSTVRLNCAQNGDANQNAGTLIGDLYQRVYRYSGGTYTLIVTLSQTGQTIPSAFATFALPSVSGPSIIFSSGDKLYIDIWLNVTTNTNGSSVQDVRLNRLSQDTTGLTGDTNAAITTPGYQPTPPHLTSSGGFGALLLLQNWLAQNVNLTTTLTSSDYGGVAFNVVDTNNYYELIVRDGATAPTSYAVIAFGGTLILNDLQSANTAQLYKTVNGIRSALGPTASISWTRGTGHTFSVAAIANIDSTVIIVTMDGNILITYTDSNNPLGIGQVGLINNIGSSIYTSFSAISDDVVSYLTSMAAHNYLRNNNFNFGSSGWAENGSFTGRITFPSNPTFGVGAHATLTLSNQPLGFDSYYQGTYSIGGSPTQYVIPGQQYCFSAVINVTSPFVNGSAFIQLNFQDITSASISSVGSSPITSSGRFFVQGTAPANSFFVNAIFGGVTTNTTNSGTCTFTSLQLEPVWFPDRYTYPTSICDWLQPDCATLPDGTTSRADRLISGFITHLTASYEGPVRTWDVEVTAGDLLLENSVLVNNSYSNVNDVDIIQGIVNALPNSPLHATSVADNTGDIAAGILSDYNISICVPGTTISSLQFSDATLREVLNALADITGFSYGVDPYYNVYYHPPFYTQCPYGFSSTPDNLTTFPYYDYSIEYDGTQIHNALRVVGDIFSTTVTETWAFQDGSHAETVQTGKTVNVNLFHIPNALPTGLIVGGSSISCGEDTGTGYGTSQSIVTLTTFGVPGLLSFPSPGYAAGTSISIAYSYDTLAYVSVQSPDSIAQYGRPIYSKINDTDLNSLASCAIRGEAELEEYAQPRVTLKFKTNMPVNVGQVIEFTSALDNITKGHYSVQKVTARYLGNKTNEYEIEAGTYVDSFVDFFRNTQKAVNSLDHDPSAAIQQINIMQQDSMIINDSLSIRGV